MLHLTRRSYSGTTYLVLQVLLHTAAVFCVVNYVLDSFLKGLSQKPLVAAILVEITLSFNALLREQSDNLFSIWRQQTLDIHGDGR